MLLTQLRAVFAALHFRRFLFISFDFPVLCHNKMGEMKSPRWGYFRIITGTIVGGILGFYFMHRAELKYKEMWDERLRKYEEEMNARKNVEAKSNEFQESR